MGKVLVIRAEEGKIVSSDILDGDFAKIAKDVTARALTEWNPEESDLTALRTKLELRYPKPLPPEIADKILELSLKYSLEGNDVIVNLPVLVVSFDNRWIDETTYLDKKIYVIALYLDDNAKKQLEEYAAEATKAPKSVEALTGAEQLTLSEEELRRLEEGLAEVEEEETTKKTRRKRSRRKKS
ncbi:DUF2286 domain-containing protein [Hyperthermus butylicus]|uniref:Conserved crenarchaeal protein n=1 Tax=Hyperthermus butylicus (strain DSM 5456 / JCM 9403 / PLM1-5) TaxID=415426 RepID=A2BM94_HYPBU|nr:DUF2286 domain-containing protein [Hyperthermus butylicus]ABM81105.1 conserved crenarchaeal protein [Hyperthermus butylicus DSM 5456]